MKIGHRGIAGRLALLALAALCLGLVVAVPLAQAAPTSFTGNTYGQANNAKMLMQTTLALTASNPATINQIFTSSTSGFYAYNFDVGSGPFYADLKLTAIPILSGGMQPYFSAKSISVEGNPGQFVVNDITMVVHDSALSGKVKNKKSGHAIKGATVAVQVSASPAYSAKTPKDGTYSIVGMKLWPGMSVNVKVSAKHYKTKTVSFVPTVNGTKSLSISLTKKK